MRSPISVLAIRGGPGRRSFDCGERRVGALKLQGLKLQFQVRRYAGAEESVSQLALEMGGRIWHEGACQTTNRILRIKPSCCPPM